MNRKIPRIPLTVMVAALVAAAWAETRFKVTSIGVTMTLYDIGNDGTAEGEWHKAAVWNRAYGLMTIPPPQNSYLYAKDINNGGTVVGYCSTDIGGGVFVRNAFLWKLGTGTILFQGFGLPSEAYGVNDLGHIVGRYGAQLGTQYSFLWRAPGDYTVLPGLHPGDSTQALAVNDSDWVVGNNGVGTAILWKPDGSVTGLGAPPGQTQTDPVDVNDNGTVATVTSGSLGFTVGFVLYRDGTWLQVLNPVWPGAQTYPRSMNDADAVVGDLVVSQGVSKAFLWTPGKGTRGVDGMLDPTAAGWDVTYIFGVNDHGQMCGYGVYQGVGYGVVLDPVLVSVTPSSYTVNLGRRDAGGAGSLAAVDGDVLRVCRFIVPNLAAAPVDVRIDGTFASGDCLGVTLRVVSRMKNAGAFGQTLELWDWQTGDWDAKDVRTDPVGTGWQTVELVASGDVRRILKADGSLRARYRVRQTGPAATLAWCNEVDQAVWMVAP